ANHDRSNGGPAHFAAAESGSGVPGSPCDEDKDGVRGVDSGPSLEQHVQALHIHEPAEKKDGNRLRCEAEADPNGGLLIRWGLRRVPQHDSVWNTDDAIWRDTERQQV